MLDYRLLLFNLAVVQFVNIKSIFMCLSFLLLEELIKIHRLQRLEAELVDLPHYLIDEVLRILRVGDQNEFIVILAWSLRCLILLLA